jgi:D-glycero-alpha-D-manno-heptose-7-phosphate kinase
VGKEMILTRTPLRISFVGGGTDFKSFYEIRRGSVVSATISRYIYVMVNKRFDDQIRIGYSKTEIVNNIDSINHGIVRECLRKVGITKGIEIVTVADIPSTGSGLGSSSTLTVGLLNALHRYKHETVSKEDLAREACEIEIDILGEPIGKQDQYAAAYGGINHIQFETNGRVSIHPIKLSDSVLNYLTTHTGLYYTNISRNSRDILTEQKTKISENFDKLVLLSDMADELHEELKTGVPINLGRYLHNSWNIKRTLASNVTNESIDETYEYLRKIGVSGGKLVGAGGGGFLLFFIDNRRHWDMIDKYLKDRGYKSLSAGFEFGGSKCLIPQ